MARIPDEQMGDVWPEALPGAEGADYGRVTFEGPARCPVRSYQTFALTYRAGQYGLDDTGAVKLVTRWTADNGPVQVTDPAAPNYVTATASNGVHLRLYAEPYPHQRPWYNGLRVTVERGYLSPGDTIRLVLGDRSGGSPGYRMQTFCETAHVFKLLADPCATGVFVPVGEGAVEIVGGPVARWAVVGPTVIAPGVPFAIGVRAEDAWGNATAPNAHGLQIMSDTPVHGLPEEVRFAEGAVSTKVGGLSVSTEGVTRLTLVDKRGAPLAVSNPIVCQADGPGAYWGDLHGQSGETVGINRMEDYVRFGRDVAFLDVMSHQANDFQVKAAFWEEINARSAAFDDPGRFVMFPGYEWSGNTPVGGDHNVIFRHEGEQIRRSSHALLTDRSDIDTDAPTLTHLFDGLRGTDCVVLAHIGGRPADIGYAHDPVLRTSVEVHSDWGTFEWVLTDAFELGYRVGVVANSDGHKGAPGMCHPGASEFGAYSGLTCFRADTLSRDGIFRALRRRHHYATSGGRLHLDVRADLGAGGWLYPEDPAWSTMPPVPATETVMGDIATTEQGSARLSITCRAHAPIERIDVLNGAVCVQTLRPYGEEDLGARLRVIWEGAEYRGRGRQTRWRGTVRLRGPEIQHIAKINAWNHERLFEVTSADTVAFDAVTTGNFGGCDLWLTPERGTLAIETDHAQGVLDLDRVGLEDVTFEAGGLGRRLRIFRLPERLETMDVDVFADVPLQLDRDNPLWVRVTTEDGCVAWSSPIYILPKDGESKSR